MGAEKGVMHTELGKLRRQLEVMRAMHLRDVWQVSSLTEGMRVRQADELRHAELAIRLGGDTEYQKVLEHVDVLHNTLCQMEDEGESGDEFRARRDIGLLAWEYLSRLASDYNMALEEESETDVGESEAGGDG